MSGEIVLNFDEVRRQLVEAEKFIAMLANQSAIGDCEMIHREGEPPMFYRDSYKGLAIYTAHLDGYRITPKAIHNKSLVGDAVRSVNNEY